MSTRKIIPIDTAYSRLIYNVKHMFRYKQVGFADISSHQLEEDRRIPKDTFYRLVSNGEMLQDVSLKTMIRLANFFQVGIEDLLMEDLSKRFVISEYDNSLLDEKEKNILKNKGPYLKTAYIEVKKSAQRLGNIVITVTSNYISFKQVPHEVSLIRRPVNFLTVYPKKHQGLKVVFNIPKDKFIDSLGLTDTSFNGGEHPVLTLSFEENHLKAKNGTAYISRETILDFAKQSLQYQVSLRLKKFKKEYHHLSLDPYRSL